MSAILLLYIFLPSLYALNGALVNTIKSEVRDFVQKELLGQEDPFLDTSFDDLQVEEISGGVTNYGFKVFDAKNHKHAVFVKHAKETMKGWKDIQLTSDRLRLECLGMRAFSRTSAAFIPEVIIFDNEKKYLVVDWLHDYTSLRRCFIEGSFDAGVARKMGTLMGRSHGI